MTDDLIELRKNAALNRNAFEKKLNKLKKTKDNHLDEKIHALHKAAFKNRDCLDCANCCKTLGPLLTHKDVDRIAKHLRMKPGAFIGQYLRVDEDQDYVMKQMPCAFLGSDNYCSIYDVRPKACADFPNTDLRKQKTMLHLTLKNTETCPAVYEIVEKL
ncbi:MAG: Fe-S-cluster containining protein [Flavobacteriales bacterium]|jgi:Fe-S-cluster containining protein